MSIWGVLIIAFLAGIEGVIDEWEFHQPIVACTLVGLATGNLVSGIALGASLQLVTLGWMNIGAAVAPDPALAAVVAAWWVSGPAHLPVAAGVILAIPLALIGQGLTQGLRKLIIPLVDQADVAAAAGNLKRISWLQRISVVLQGLRVLVPTALLMWVPTTLVHTSYQVLPQVIQGGIRVSAGLLVVVSFAIVINMMATRQLWPFFFIGFALATDSHLSLVALGLIAVGLAILYLRLAEKDHHDGGGPGSDTDTDELDRELDDL